MVEGIAVEKSLLLHPTGTHRADRLTPAERRVLAGIAAGKSSREVAEQLFVSKRTVDFHLASIYRFLGVGNRIQAINAARERGLL